MGNDLFYSTKQIVKYWWVSLLIGLLAITLGFWCISAPASTLIILGAIFIAGFLIIGVSQIIFAIANRKILRGWGWTLGSGIVDILFACLLLAIPLRTIETLLLLTGFWVIFQSIWGIGTSIDLRRNDVQGWGWILTFGILGLIISFTLIANPLFAATFIVYLLSLSLVSSGIMKIAYALKMRSIHNVIKDTEED